MEIQHREHLPRKQSKSKCNIEMKTTAIVSPVYRKIYKCEYCFALLPQKVYAHNCPDPEASDIEKAPVKDSQAHKNFVTMVINKRYAEVV